MIAAAKRCRLAARAVGDRHPAMTADIVERPQRLVLSAHDQHGGAAHLDILDPIAARRRQFLRAPHIQPAPAIDCPQIPYRHTTTPSTLTHPPPPTQPPPP